MAYGQRLALICALLLGFFATSAFAIPAPPGTSILNTASITFDEGGPTIIASSNTPDCLVNSVVTTPSSFWLTKSVNRGHASIGDTLHYTLVLENSGATDAPSVSIHDRLPPGFSYQAGSALGANGLAVPATLSPDGRSISFLLGDLLADNSTTIDYAVTIGAGAKPGEAVNTAQATDAIGSLSNLARASVDISEELFASQSFIVGRVMSGGCSENEKNLPGVANARIFLEDGSYIISDENGNYHFEGVAPGTHVVQLDPTTLPSGYTAIDCEDDTRSAKRAESRFVDLQPGSMWRVDFNIYKRPLNGEVNISVDNEYAIGEAANYTLTLSGKTVPVMNQLLEIDLPPEAEYLPGSALLDGQALPDPEISGTSLTFSLPDTRDSWSRTITFKALINGQNSAKEMVTLTRLKFNTPGSSSLSTPDAQCALIWIPHHERKELQEILLRPQFDTLNAKLTATDRQELEKIIAQIATLDLIKIYVVGHTDARRIRWHEGIPYRDNFELSEARAKAVADRLLEALELSPEQVITIGMGASTPVADNSTREGMALNRRTELRGIHRTQPDPSLATVNAQGGKVKTMKTAANSETVAMEESVQEIPVGILEPNQGSRVATPINAVRVRLDSGLTPHLYIDGKEIPAERIGMQALNKENRKKLVVYIGVDFGEPGEHEIVLKGVGPFGNVRFTDTISVQRTGEIDRFEIVATDGNIADGRTPIRIALRTYDSNGILLSTPYSLKILEGELRPHRPGMHDLDQIDASNLLQVASDGTAEFSPMTTSGSYPIKLAFGDKVVETELHVRPELRDEWILVGLAEGTVGYNTIDGNKVDLPDGVEEDLYEEGRIAFYAKGIIKGEWLLTLAYDSDKQDADGEHLHDTIDPDRYYMLYGDAAKQRNDAASSRKLYVKLERDSFYALFGDYNTGLTTTELSRYSRSLTGLKSEWHGDYGELVVFATDTGQAFLKDEIEGDGTSGYYYLSGSDIVINSEKVVIETRDRLRNEVIVESKPLTRYLDYDIDYNHGTLFFKEPIQGRDRNFNPIFIVADYEVKNSDEKSMTYGGRAAANIAEALEVGASYISEDLGTRTGELIGIDTSLQLGKDTEFKAEVAETENASSGMQNSATAKLAEIVHGSKRLAGRLWWREQESNFGLGQQSSSEETMRKYGLEGDYRLSSTLDIDTLLYREENLSTDAERNVVEAGIVYHQKSAQIRTGVRYAEDSFADGRSFDSTQAFIGGDWKPAQRLTLRANHEQSIGESENIDFPTRTLLGADYQLLTPVNIFAEQEFTDSEHGSTNATRAGLRATPWRGGSLKSAFERKFADNVERIYSVYGLQQKWQLGSHWDFDVSYDHAETLKTSLERVNPNSVPTSGNDDYSAVSLGSNYRQTTWGWWNRLEYRTSDIEDRWNLLTGAAGEIRPGVGIGARINLFRSELTTGEQTEGELTLSGAWRPVGSRWIILDRLDFKFDNATSSAEEEKSQRIINNLHANYKPDRHTQYAFQYGAKYVQERLLGTDWSGYTDLLGLEIRRDLGSHWDIGVHGGMLNSWDLGKTDWRSGASLGYLAAKNMWVSLGYNVTGFRDEDFSAADYTAQGAFIRFRVKFDQGSMKDLLRFGD